MLVPLVRVVVISPFLLSLHYHALSVHVPTLYEQITVNEFTFVIKYYALIVSISLCKS